MEYLDMHGVVKLKTTADCFTVNNILMQLLCIEFVDTGYFYFKHKDHLLMVDAEGPISESQSIKVLLNQLQEQLANDSMIIINNVRWETKVLLKSRNPPSTELFDESAQLALAQ